MVLTVSLFKRKATDFLNLLFFLLILYVVVNYIYLIWYIANPEGFWGLNYFWELIVAGIMLLILIAVCIFLITGIVTSLYKIIVGKGDIRELLKLSGILIVVLLLTGFNYFYGRGFSLYISKKLSNKYSYIKKTEELLSEGDKIAALDYAKSAYQKESNREKVSPYLFLAKLYSETNFDRKQKLITKYATLINYANCLEKNPNFITKSELLFNTGLKLINSDLVKDEKNNLAIFPTLSLAEINLNKGNYFQAEKYFDELYKLNESSDDDDLFYIIESNLLLSDYALRIGDVNKAMKLQIENIDLYEKSDLSKTSSNYLSLLLLATTSEIYFQNFGKASEFLLKASPIAEKKRKKAIYNQYLTIKANYCISAAENNSGNESIIDKGWWENMKEVFTAKLSLKQELLREAESCLTENLEIIKEKTGDESFEYLQGLCESANLYTRIGNFSEAQNKYNAALTILRPNKNSNYDFYYGTLLNSILIGSNKGLNKEYLDEIEQYYYRKTVENYFFQTEDEKVTFSLHLEKQFDKINSIYVTSKTQNAGASLYNNVLALKNIALYSNQNVRDYLNRSDSTLKKDYQKLLAEKEKLLTVSPSTKKTQQELNNKQRKLILQINSSPSFNEINPRVIKYIDIKNSLQQNEVAIELANVPIYINGKSDRSYFALILKQNSSVPEIIPLFMESELSAILNKKGETRTRINSIYVQEKERLNKLIWDKIENKISLNSKIYLSVSGILHTISFPALLSEKSYDITYLESTREIAVKKMHTSEKSKIALFGNINFRANRNNSPKSQNRTFAKNLNFSLLPYSKNEIDGIMALFKKEINDTISVFSKNRATEENFRKLHGSKFDIIHIATHGFYDKYGRTTSQIDNSINENVLLKSGLVFSNLNPNSMNSKNDGILSSFEISQMDLSGVDLVTLSACETGLGDIKGNEGVFGLRRAFKLAGVKTMIVSLWQVPDKSTSELMVHFYEFYLKGFSKKESLKKAQELIKMKYKLPFYWAGFVLLE